MELQWLLKIIFFRLIKVQLCLAGTDHCLSEIFDQVLLFYYIFYILLFTGKISLDVTRRMAMKELINPL